MGRHITLALLLYWFIYLYFSLFSISVCNAKRDTQRYTGRTTEIIHNTFVSLCALSETCPTIWMNSLGHSALIFVPVSAYALIQLLKLLYRWAGFTWYINNKLKRLVWMWCSHKDVVQPSLSALTSIKNCEASIKRRVFGALLKYSGSVPVLTELPMLHSNEVLFTIKVHFLMQHYSYVAFAFTCFINFLDNNPATVGPLFRLQFYKYDDWRKLWTCYR